MGQRVNKSCVKEYLDHLLFKVTAVSFNDTSDQILSGGIDNEIKVSSHFSL